MAWYNLRLSGLSLFEGIDKKTCIAILGTSYIGALLILEAKAFELKNIILLDSNEKRIGNYLLGEKITHPTLLKSNSILPDLIITSSERDQEAALFAMLNNLCPMSKVTSWKILIAQQINNKGLCL